MPDVHKPHDVSSRPWLTVERARERLEHIRSIAGDDEKAHNEEDKLRGDALDTIAALTEIVLETRSIDFARWCA